MGLMVAPVFCFVNTIGIALGFRVPFALSLSKGAPNEDQPFDKS